jgi:putative Holliday junction resolvase
MRTLGIDFGTRRIGLAMSDESGRLATPLDVLHVSSPELAIPPIARLIQKEDVERIVVGLPLNMDDESIGPAARSTMAWARELSASSGKPILFVDERLSSFAAEQGLNDRKRAGEKITRKQKKERLDALAAAGFLQAFLDGKLAVIEELE